MTLANLIAADVVDVFLNVNDFAVTATYQRGGAEISLVVLVSESQFEVSTEFGITRVETRDYIFRTNLLTFGTSSGQAYPERGDKIIEGANTYVVTSPGGGADVYSFEDENRYLMRVRTVLSKGN